MDGLQQLTLLMERVFETCAVAGQLVPDIFTRIYPIIRPDSSYLLYPYSRARRLPILPSR